MTKLLENRIDSKTGVILKGFTQETAQTRQPCTKITKPMGRYKRAAQAAPRGTGTGTPTCSNEFTHPGWGETGE